MNPTLDRPRIEALSSLRFFAAAYIFLFHALAMKILDRVQAPAGLKYFAEYGYIAVTFFFVLSGFVLVYGYADRVTDTVRFVKSRLARIYPAYLIGLAFGSFFLYAVILMNVPDFRWFARHQVLMIVSTLTLTQSWIPQGAMGWNAPGWAVSVFMFYYVIFPAASRRMAKMSTRAMFGLVTAAWLCSLSVATAYVVFAPDGVRHVDRTYGLLTWLNFVKFNPVMRLSEFLIGMAIGYTVLRETPSAKRAQAALSGGVALLALLIAVGKWVPYPVMHTGLSAPAFALIIYGLTVPPKWLSWLAAKPLTALGDASLSFYLLHANMMGMFLMDWHHPNAPLSWVRVVFVFLFTTGLSLALYRWYEVPARKKFDPAKKKATVETREAVAA